MTGDEDDYLEAQRMIKKCVKQKRKALDFSHLRLVTLPPEIYDLKELKKLEIGGFKYIDISELFNHLTELEYFEIWGVSNIPDNIGNLKNLKELYLNSDRLKSLPESLGKCINLRSIYINSNMLTKLPESFVRLKNLRIIHFETFNLKKLPSAFGKLRLLEEIDIFSGALTTLPESMGNLKNLKKLKIDAYNVKEQPSFLKRFSHVEDKWLNLGRVLQPLVIQRHHSYYSPNSFGAKYDDLLCMSFKYRQKYLENRSLKELESLLLCAPHISESSWLDKDIVDDIMYQRYTILSEQFKPTKKNVLRVVGVSENFLKSWEKGIAIAKVMVEDIYTKTENKTSFNQNYDIEIKLHPQVLYKNSKTKEWHEHYGIHDVLIS